MKSKCVKWRVAAKRGKIKAQGDEGRPAEGPGGRALERTKTQIPSRVAHPFHVVKNLVGHRKVRYKGVRQEHGAAVWPVRVGEPGDYEKSAIVGPWEQSVMCAKIREMRLVFESNSPKSILVHFVIPKIFHQLVRNLNGCGALISVSLVTCLRSPVDRLPSLPDAYWTMIFGKLAEIDSPRKKGASGNK